LTDGKGSIFLTYPRTAAGEGITYACDPNHNVTQLGVITRWTPVKNLTFSAEVMWFRLNQKFSGFATLTRLFRSQSRFTSSSTRIPSLSRFAFSVTSDRYRATAKEV